MGEGIRKVARLEIPLGKGVHLREDERPLVKQRIYDAEGLGGAFRTRRRELGYTQETAAMLCMHSTRVIGDIERGRSTVGIGVVLDYAAILGIDVTLEVRGGGSS